MCIALRLSFAALLAGVALPSAARQDDDSDASIEAAVARVLSDSMPTERRPRARDWGDFERRSSADVVWSIPPPGDPATAPQGCDYSRSGWFTVRGATAEILACGGIQQIEALSVEVSGLWLGRTDVIEELEAYGVTAVLQHSIEAAPSRGSDDGRSNGHYRSLLARYPASRRWRLERSEEEAATLTADWRCTRPGTRSATRCSMTWSLVFARTQPPVRNDSEGSDPDEASQS
ncbi:MAG: hypothetical protein M3Q74_12595 [Pseudomonadota bacterium]|nr:hypothetical protein [Pseudomonadota bacterium]